MLWLFCFIGGYFLGCHAQCLNAFNETHINTPLPATLTKLHTLAGFTNSINLFPSFDGLCQFPIDVNQSISISISISILMLWKQLLKKFCYFQFIWQYTIYFPTFCFLPHKKLHVYNFNKKNDDHKCSHNREFANLTF